MTLCLSSRPGFQGLITIPGLLFLPLILCLPPETRGHSLYLSVGVEEAMVALDDTVLGYTDSKGIFFAEPVKPGYHNLLIEKEGYRIVNDTVLVPQDLTCNYTEPLEQLRMIIINEHTGLEVENVGGPYTIQLGAFHSLENAERLATMFYGGAFEPRLESAEVKEVGEVHRVRLALFNTLDEAREEAAGIMRKTKDDVWVVGLDGRDWAVQLGAFSSREQAEKLAARFDDPTFYIWIEDTPAGIFRVKAGYWADKEAAREFARKTGSSLGIEPIVIQVR